VSGSLVVGKMAKFGILILLTIVVLTNGEDDGSSVPSMQGLKISCDTEPKFNFIIQHHGKAGFDFLRLSRDRSVPIEVLVAQDKLLSFKFNLMSRGIQYEIFISDVGSVIEEELALQRGASAMYQNGSLTLKAFPRYNEIMNYLYYLEKNHSDVAEVLNLGKSYENRSIIALKLSSGESNKPALVIDAGIHAREWIAPTTALYTIKQLAENASNRYIFENIDIYIIPSLNPDGYEYTHKSSATRMWRKTRSFNSDSDCMGTDPNRNFDYQWNTVGASSDPCSEIYAGSAPFSEPETAALRDFILARKGQIKAYVTLHSYGNYFLHPWGFTSDLPENEPTLRCVAERAVDELTQVRGTAYEIGSSTNVLYAAAGGSDDWAMAIGKAELSYTIELPGGRYGFAPPPSEIIPVGQETFKAIQVIAQYIEGGICNS
ncbi:hypothetical protein QAD02_019994, partial [Eretmocerus hayati]